MRWPGRILFLTGVALAITAFPTAGLAGGDALPLGTRAWECIPGVIRNNGQESFLLEVNTNGAVSAVVLNSLSARLIYPTPAPLVLHDDGTAGDRAAGDYVFTTGPIRYDLGAPMAGYYLNDSASPAGLESLVIGEISIFETNGATTRFLVGPSIGLLRSDIPATFTVRLSPEVVASAHLANIQTSTRETQCALRKVGGDLRRLTAPAYRVLPDAYDFWFFFCSDKVERTPRTASENFEAGRHVTAQVNYNGTGQARFNDSGSYGSGGALLGLNILDVGERGTYSANATHEMLHQWASYLDASLGLSDADGHYNARSSAGSLLGGQVWAANGDGTYSLDCDEGRNGAHRADPLDLYMMGLLEPSELSIWYLYAASSPPPLLRCADRIADIARVVSSGAILVRHGARTPGPADAQRRFAIAFAVESHDRALNATEMTYYETLAAAYAKALPAADPDPYVGFNWAPITRFFGPQVAWSSDLQPDDFNGDGRANNSDLQIISACSSGAGVLYQPAFLRSGCSVKADAQGIIPPDFDRDGDVDQDDFGWFQRAYTGP